MLGRWIEAGLVWAEANSALLGWSFVLSIIFFVGSLLAMPVLVSRLRADYFIRRAPGDDTWLGRHPVARMVTRAIRNTLGAVLLLAGLAMMVLPGQGVITILIALSLLEFPGKRRLELSLVRQPQVNQAIAWIRQRAGRPPLQLPDA